MMKFIAEIICNREDIIKKFEIEDSDIVSATKKANILFTDYRKKNGIRIGEYKLKISKVI